MATAQRPVFGPNDHNMVGGKLESGLGAEVEAQIRASRGEVVLDEPPEKSELRKQAKELQTKAHQLSLVERELEKEKEEAARALQDKQDELDAREAELLERERIFAETGEKKSAKAK